MIADGWQNLVMSMTNTILQRQSGGSLQSARSTRQRGTKSWSVGPRIDGHPQVWVAGILPAARSMNRAGMEFVARVASPSRLGWDKLLCRFALNLPCVVPARLTCHCQEQANGSGNGNSRRLIVYAYRIAVTRRAGSTRSRDSTRSAGCREQSSIKMNKNRRRITPSALPRRCQGPCKATSL